MRREMTEVSGELVLAYSAVLSLPDTSILLNHNLDLIRCIASPGTLKVIPPQRRIQEGCGSIYLVVFIGLIVIFLQ
jgi:hypothetical protein